MLEVEVKIKLNKEDYAEKLQALGFLKTTGEYEKDTYFNGKQKDIREEDKALRIREHRILEVYSASAENDKANVGSSPKTVASTYTMNYKGPKLDHISMTREEVEFEIPSYESGEVFLRGLGYQASGVVEKERTHLVKGNITCCMDEVTGLGSFLEVEIMSEESGYEAAISQIEALLSKLGLSMKDTQRHSYLSMLEQGCQSL